MSKLFPVYCGSCGRCVARSQHEYPNRYKVFCDFRCAAEPPFTSESARNDTFTFLGSKGLSPNTIAKIFSTPHGNVYKIRDRLLSEVVDLDANGVSIYR